LEAFSIKGTQYFSQMSLPADATAKTKYPFALAHSTRSNKTGQPELRDYSSAQASSANGGSWPA
jgi:hypothetical protein